MKKINPLAEMMGILILALAAAILMTVISEIVAKADSYEVQGKKFSDKGSVVEYVLTHNKTAVITETREVTLNLKTLGFKKAKVVRE